MNQESGDDVAGGDNPEEKNRNVNGKKPAVGTEDVDLIKKDGRKSGE